MSSAGVRVALSPGRPAPGPANGPGAAKLTDMEALLRAAASFEEGADVPEGLAFRALAPEIARREARDARRIAGRGRFAPGWLGGLTVGALGGAAVTAAALLLALRPGGTTPAAPPAAGDGRAPSLIHVASKGAAAPVEEADEAPALAPQAKAAASVRPEWGETYRDALVPWIHGPIQFGGGGASRQAAAPPSRAAVDVEQQQQRPRRHRRQEPAPAERQPRPRRQAAPPAMSEQSDLPRFALGEGARVPQPAVAENAAPAQKTAPSARDTAPATTLCHTETVDRTAYQLVAAGYVAEPGAGGSGAKITPVSLNVALEPAASGGGAAVPAGSGRAAP